jgi:hypothetical protein
MNPHQMTGLKVMLSCSMIAVIGSALWALMPVGENGGYEGVVTSPTEGDVESIPAINQPEKSEFPRMELWTKPPPVVVPPSPPPALRLNAELLAIRWSDSETDRIATLYLVETGEIVRLREGDEHQGMAVVEISESAIRFTRGNQSLTITREGG